MNSQPEDTPEQSWPNSFGNVVGEAHVLGATDEPPTTTLASHAFTAPIVPDYQQMLHPSKENWASAQAEITALEKEQRRRLDAQTPVAQWVTVFDEDVPEDVMSDFATANRLKVRLTAAGIAWKERYTSRDCERMVADPTSSGGWSLEFGSVTSLVIEVADTDAQQARQVLAEKEPPQAAPPAPIQREFQPRVIPSKDSWIAARQEITNLENKIGCQKKKEAEIFGSSNQKPEQPKAWRNNDGEDGWDVDG